MQSVIKYWEPFTGKDTEWNKNMEDPCHPRSHILERDYNVQVNKSIYRVILDNDDELSVYPLDCKHHEGRSCICLGYFQFGRLSTESGRLNKLNTIFSHDLK